MVVEVDLFAIKERIVSILGKDTTLFSATGADGKVRKIIAGSPRIEFDSLKETTLPIIFVTHENQISNILRKTGFVNNSITSLEHTIRLKIILLAEEKDGFDVEEVIDDFVKLILEDIEEDIQLKDGGNPICDSCIPERIYDLSTTQKGYSRQGRIITLKILKTTGAV